MPVLGVWDPKAMADVFQWKLPATCFTLILFVQHTNSATKLERCAIQLSTVYWSIDLKLQHASLKGFIYDKAPSYILLWNILLHHSLLWYNCWLFGKVYHFPLPQIVDRAIEVSANTSEAGRVQGPAHEHFSSALPTWHCVMLRTFMN